mgnify:CR=1 FL=1
MISAGPDGPHDSLEIPWGDGPKKNREVNAPDKNPSWWILSPASQLTKNAALRHSLNHSALILYWCRGNISPNTKKTQAVEPPQYKHRQGHFDAQPNF